MRDTVGLNDLLKDVEAQPHQQRYEAFLQLKESLLGEPKEDQGLYALVQEELLPSPWSPEGEQRQPTPALSLDGYAVQFGPWRTGSSHPAFHPMENGDVRSWSDVQRRLAGHEAWCRRRGVSLQVFVYVNVKTIAPGDSSTVPCLVGAFPLFTTQGTLLYKGVERVPIVQLVPHRQKLSHTQASEEEDSVRHLANLHVVDFTDQVRACLKRVFQKVRKALEKRTPFPLALAGLSALVDEALAELLTGPLVPPVQDVNPLASLSQKREITFRGPGGFQGNYAPWAWRGVHHSHCGRICVTETPESEHIGLNLHLALPARVEEGHITAPYVDVRSQMIRRLKPLEEDRQAIVSAVEQKNTDGRDALVLARVGSAVHHVPWDTVAYRERYPGQMLGMAAHLIPFIQHDDNNRAMMGAKNMKQALPLKHAEPPLIRTGTEALVGRISGTCLLAHEAGEVLEVSAQRILVRTAHGDEVVYPLETGRPSAGGALIRHQPVVSAGDKVERHHVLADGVCTRRGDLALGVNLVTAYMPYRGWNFEDGIVISDRLVREDLLTSVHVVEEVFSVCEGEHMTQEEADRAERKVKASGQTARDVADVYACRGVYGIAGRPVRKGDTLFAKVCWREGSVFIERKRSSVNGVILEVLHRERDQTAGPDAVGTHPFAAHGRIRYEKVCWILTERKIQVGDKLMGRHGNKGVVARIVPQDDMPHLKDGTPVDVILNPHGVVSRMNLGQLLETHWGWVVSKAREKGLKEYEHWALAPPFEKRSEQALREAFRHLADTGVDEEGKFELLDGKKGPPFHSRVVVGVQYFMKLNHLAADKLHAREGGDAPFHYSLIPRQPLKGKKRRGGQRLGEMELWALLTHGCPDIIWEMTVFKSDAPRFQQTDLTAQYWRTDVGGLYRPDLFSGRPKGALAYTETLFALVMFLRGLALDLIFVTPQGEELDIFDVKKADASGKPAAVEAVLLKPASDETIRKWAENREVTCPHFPFLVNGVWKYPAKSLFDQDIFGGGLKCSAEERRRAYRERMGYIPLARPVLHPLLLDPLTRTIRDEVKKLDPKKREALAPLWVACRCGRLRGTACLKDPECPRCGTKARPNLRNLLRREGNRFLEEIEGHLPRLSFSAYRLNSLPVLPLDFRPLEATLGGASFRSPLNDFYRSVVVVNENIKNTRNAPADSLRLWEKSLQRAVSRLMIGDTRSRKAGQSAIMDLVQGKEGILRMHLLGKRVNLSARAVIVPAPELKPDQVYLPRSMLVTLLRSRIAAVADKAEGAGRDAEARRRLQIEDMLQGKSHEVDRLLLDLLRDTWVVLNRSPSLHKYSLLSFQPVPWPHETIGLHPLVCSFFNADFDGDTMAVFLPILEQPRREAETMRPSRHCLSAANGRLLYHFDQDIVLGMSLFTSSPEGWEEFHQRLGCPAPPEPRPVSKKALLEAVSRFHVTHGDPDKTAALAQWIMETGFKTATAYGLSFGLFDIPTRQEVLGLGHFGPEEALDEKLHRWLHAESAREKPNPLALLYTSGAKGSLSQIRQLGLRRGQLQDIRMQDIGPPVEGNFRDGVAPLEYYLGSHAGRRTMCEKKLSVAAAGDFTRLLVEACYPLMIRTDDCGTPAGIPLETASEKACFLGRCLVGDGTVLDEKRLESQEWAEEAVRVRSVLTCRASEAFGYGAVCQRCYGWDLSRRDFPPLGFPVGVLAAQSIGERGTQLTMRTFHTGGAGAGRALTSQLDRMKKLLALKPLKDVQAPPPYAEEKGSLQKLLQHEGLDALRRLCLTFFHDIYEGAVDERHMEVVLKAMMLPHPGRLTPLGMVPFHHPAFLARAAFRAARKVLAEAAVDGSGRDPLDNPKSRLMVGLFQEGAGP
uniref:DNA-directed RNA polymerase n=1 Tax=Desulfacinum infernum TaxID=35837 RepID=A0A832EK03_9BACT